MSGVPHSDTTDFENTISTRLRWHGRHASLQRGCDRALSRATALHPTLRRYCRLRKDTIPHEITKRLRSRLRRREPAGVPLRLHPTPPDAETGHPSLSRRSSRTCMLLARDSLRALYRYTSTTIRYLPRLVSYCLTAKPSLRTLHTGSAYQVRAWAREHHSGCNV